MISSFSNPTACIGPSASTEATATLERGLNEVVITLERDPYGVLLADACADGETLRYLEDFQDLDLAIERLRDPADPVLDWDDVKRELLGQD